MYKRQDFWKFVESSDAKFGYIRDVTNASKHVKIGDKSRPSTGMTHIKDTQIVFIGWGQDGRGQRRFGGGPNVVFDDAGSQIGFDDCATELYEYWKNLLQVLKKQDLSLK